MAEDETQKSDECLNCAKLRDESARFAVDRQRLIELLATERERANALFVSYPPQGTSTLSQPPPEHPVFSLPSPFTNNNNKPLRYKVADKLNDAVKNQLPIAHRIAKRTLSALRGRPTRG